jgi:hypothetical protein
MSEASALSWGRSSVENADVAMMRSHVVALPLIVGVAATVLAPAARANNVVTYEVVSDSISQAGVEYVDGSGRKLLQSVRLPWRFDVTLDDARGPTGRGAQIRADWRPTAAPARWVTVRIYDGADLLCQSTLDVGNATCYGNTPHLA